MWGQKQKTEQYPIQPQINQTISDLDREIERLRAEQQRQSQNPIQQIPKGDKQALYFKRIEEVEGLVRYCKSKGLVTAKDWHDHDIPIKQACEDLIKALREYTDFKIDELRTEIKNIDPKQVN